MTFVPATQPYLHPYQTANVVCNDEVVGYLGKVTYELQKEEDMRESAYVMEIDIASLEKYYGNVPHFNPLPKFAEESRDLALVMEKTVTNGQVEEVIKKACQYVKEVKLFDVYEGVQIGLTKKSMAYSIVFTPKDEEFTSELVDGFVKKILKNLKNTLDIDLRS